MHIKGVHEQIRDNPCNQCEKTFSQSGHLLHHIRTVHEGIKFPCNQTKSYIKSVHKKIRYPCNQYDYKGYNINSVNRYIQSEHEGIKYPCNQCEYQATRQSSLKSHITAVHEQIRDHQCSHCEKSSSISGTQMSSFLVIM